jgi:hypothetical protein
MFTHGLDSATITPATVLTGIYLLRRKPLGYLLAPPLLVLCILNGLNVLAATAPRPWRGSSSAGCTAWWGRVVMGRSQWLLGVFRNLVEEEG